MSKVKLRLLVFTATLLLLGLSEGLHSRTSMGIGPGYKDPGVRTGDAGAGGLLCDGSTCLRVGLLARYASSAPWSVCSAVCARCSCDA